MKKILSGVFLLCYICSATNIFANYIYGEPTNIELKILDLGVQKCDKYEQSDIPTIFVPGILASWYSAYGYGKTQVKRWVPDPVTHSYDTLFNTFHMNGYALKDVFYEKEFKLRIEGSPKKSLYLFGYDWKNDNKITATLLSDLIYKIRKKYIETEGCDIGKVNIIAHSMGGLVARAMLEDMCVAYEYKKDGEILFNEQTIVIKKGKLMDYTSVECKNIPKVYNLITISTPHRGSPKSLPMWEKGDIHMVESIEAALPLKLQLGDITNSSFYRKIHGYSEKIPNGIVSIGQLLPDIDNVNTFNERLEYLFKENIEIKRQNYPKNSFLEELNSRDNIAKTWDKIENNYISYFSKFTGNKDKNNIVAYNLKNSSTLMVTDDGYMRESDDISEKMNGRDIYDAYRGLPVVREYNIKKRDRDIFGLGGDGTVPTYNLMLVPNNTTSNKVISTSESNGKFSSVEVKCFSNFISSKPELMNETILSSGLGAEDMFEGCAHTKMPILTAVKVYEQISGVDKLKSNDEDTRARRERNLLLEYIGYADSYGKYVANNTINAGLGLENDDSIADIYQTGGLMKNYSGYNMGGRVILTESNVNFSFLEKQKLSGFLNFHRSVSDKEIELDIQGNFKRRVPLSFGGELESVIRYEILSPINITIEDEQGRMIGIDPQTGMIVNEIPGAWTSGDTEGSGEPEFFLIPASGTGKVNHKIKTYGTGDGGYHIVANEINLGSLSGSQNASEALVIEGNAREHFGEDYEVTIDDGKKEFLNLTKVTPATLEFQVKNIQTSHDDITLRYSVRGENSQVKKIGYNLIYEGNTIQKKIQKDISGQIDIELPDEGIYTLEVYLLDTKGGELTNKESRVSIMIDKTGKQSSKEKSSHIQEPYINYYDVSKDGVDVFEHASLRYVIGQDGHTYGFEGNNIWRVSPSKSKREHVYESDKDIIDVFIDKSGKMLLYDGDFIRYDPESQKQIKLSDQLGKHITDFVIIDDIIYLIEEDIPGYTMFDWKKQLETLVNTGLLYQAVGVDKKSLILNKGENQKIIKNPEFEIRFGKKLEKISKKIESDFTDKQKALLRSQIESRKDKYIQSQKSEYKKQILGFFLEKLLEMAYAQ